MENYLPAIGFSKSSMSSCCWWTLNWESISCRILLFFTVMISPWELWKLHEQGKNGKQLYSIYLFTFFYSEISVFLFWVLSSCPLSSFPHFHKLWILKNPAALIFFDVYMCEASNVSNVFFRKSYCYLHILRFFSSSKVLITFVISQLGRYLLICSILQISSYFSKFEVSEWTETLPETRKKRSKYPLTDISIYLVRQS